MSEHEKDHMDYVIELLRPFHEHRDEELYHEHVATDLELMSEETITAMAHALMSIVKVVELPADDTPPLRASAIGFRRCENPECQDVHVGLFVMGKDAPIAMIEVSHDNIEKLVTDLRLVRDSLPGDSLERH